MIINRDLSSLSANKNLKSNTQNNNKQFKHSFVNQSDTFQINNSTSKNPSFSGSETDNLTESKHLFGRDLPTILEDDQIEKAEKEADDAAAFETKWKNKVKKAELKVTETIKKAEATKMAAAKAVEKEAEDAVELKNKAIKYELKIILAKGKAQTARTARDWASEKAIEARKNATTIKENIRLQRIADAKQAAADAIKDAAEAEIKAAKRAEFFKKCRGKITEGFIKCKRALSFKKIGTNLTKV